MNAIRPYLSRILAGWIAAMAGWVMSKWGVVLDAETQTALTTTGVLVILAVIQPLYGVVHKLLDRYINPTDAAKGKLSTPEKLVDQAALDVQIANRP